MCKQRWMRSGVTSADISSNRLSVKRFAVVFVSIIWLVVCVARLRAASLSGSVTTSAATIDLTAEGTTDWIQWHGSAGTTQRKSGGGSLISTYSLVGGGTDTGYSGDPRTLTWSDGTPLASGSAADGYYNLGGSGFSFTAPADTTTRTLYAHLGGYIATGALVAHLSDSSAADYTDSTCTSGSGSFDCNYTLTYAAGSGSQTLTLTWTVSGVNVTVSGAALAVSGGPPPCVPTLSLLGVGRCG